MTAEPLAICPACGCVMHPAAGCNNVGLLHAPPTTTRWLSSLRPTAAAPVSVSAVAAATPGPAISTGSGARPERNPADV